MGLFDFFRKETTEERLTRKAKEVEQKAIKQVFKNEEEMLLSISYTMLFCKFDISSEDARLFFINTIVSHLCGKDFDITDRYILSLFPLELWQREWLYNYIIARFIEKNQDKLDLLNIELGKREQAMDSKFSIVEVEGDVDLADLTYFKQKHSIVTAALQKLFNNNNINVEWLQMAVRHPSFQDISFQYNGNVFSLIIGIVKREKGKTKIYVYKDKFRRQLTECEEFGLIPCIIPFDFSNEKFIFEPFKLINSKNDQIIDILKYDHNNAIWSDWEYYNFGVNYAEYYLESKGYKIINCSNLYGVDPCINAEKDGKYIYLIVNTFNRLDPVVYGICYDMLSAYIDRKGYYMELRVCNRNQNKTIKRGDLLDLDIKGIIPIEDAIDGNTTLQSSTQHIYLRWPNQK